MYVLILTLASAFGGTSIHSIQFIGGAEVCDAAKVAWLSEQKKTQNLTATAICVKSKG
uniref:Uncharacterized protein n=1 Tax=viral metagenome TaxID=1070528 RepID=A0A6H1ZHC4_9ZZZZ